MTDRLATDYAKNYCNRTHTHTFIIEWQHKHAGFKTKHNVKVILENVVTFFSGTQCSNRRTDNITVSCTSCNMTRRKMRLTSETLHHTHSTLSEHVCLPCHRCS